MADWYVYQHDGDPLGPWSTETVADAILAGKLAPDVWVAAPGGPRWLRALDVPSISKLVEGIPTRPRRRDSGLRLMPGVVPTGQMPEFSGTMMMVNDDELIPSSNVVSSPLPESSTPDPDPVTRRSDAGPRYEDAPPTDRDVPPASSSQPTGDHRTKRSRNG